MSINNKLLPVPLEYTYPIVMKIHPNSKPFSELIYLPELGKWILSCNLLRFFKIHKIDPIVWKGRWLYKKLVNIGDDNWINLKMQIDYPIVMRHTKDYIINNLKNDINFKCKPSIIVKEDFIEQYHISRSDSKYKFNYSFDDLPDIIDSRTEKVTINVLEINPKTGESYGKYRTSFEKFIIRKQDYYKLTSSTKVSDSTKMSNQEFINKSKEKFGENKFEYLSEYKSMYEELLLKCNDCGSIFKVTPFNHLYSNKFGGCDVCALNSRSKARRYTIDKFITEAVKIHGNGMYDYSKIIEENQFDGMSTRKKLDIFCLRCKKYFKQSAKDHIQGKAGCPDCNRYIKLALFVKRWLDENNVDYQREVRYDNVYENHFVKIDYVFTNKLNSYLTWIEFNGAQHYERVQYFHKTINDFHKQLERDTSIRNHCKNNNIIFIEIPYTYDTYEKIEQLLNRVILGGEDINSIIDYSKLFKI